MERKLSKQVIESLGSTDNMSSVNEKTPTVSRAAEIAEAQMAEMAEVDETPENFKTTSRDFKNIMEKRWRRALFPNSTK